MTLPLRFRRQIESDLKAAVDWHDGQQAGLGDRFLESLTKVLDRIKSHPSIYGVVERKTRAAPLSPFPYWAPI